MAIIDGGFETLLVALALILFLLDPRELPRLARAFSRILDNAQRAGDEFRDALLGREARLSRERDEGTAKSDEERARDEQPASPAQALGAGAALAPSEEPRAMKGIVFRYPREPRFFVDHLVEVRARLLHWLTSTALLTIGLLVVRVERGRGWFPLRLGGPVTGNLAADVWSWIRNDLLPTDVRLVEVGLGAAFALQLKVALGIALIVTLPIFIYHATVFVAPGLERIERRLLARVVPLTATGLVAGILLGALGVFPLAAEAASRFSPGLGVDHFSHASALLWLLMVVSIAYGLAFVPLCLVLGLPSPMGSRLARAAGSNWRPIIFGLLLVSAALTPDDSGITMLLLTAPFAASLLALRFVRGMS